ncbi:putative wrky transcription factor 19 [Quercus suber]|uniref:Wrky transcription factor 19 n=1 Tax=Quercus suber TaxID=58331 RepID=A0AAW0LLE4_QUESU
MDLNKKGVLLSYDRAFIKNDTSGDTTLRLNCLGYGGNDTARYGCNQSNLGVNLSNASDDSCKLVLGLGPTPSAYSDKYNNVGFKKNKGLATTTLPYRVSSEGDSILQLSLSGGTNDSSSVLDISASTEADFNTFPLPNQVSVEDNHLMIPVVDEGSTSAKKSGGYMPSLLFAPRTDNAKVSMQTQELLELGTKPQSSYELSSTTEYSMGTISEQATTGTSSDHRTSNSKKCKFLGCTKGTNFCVAHGGGKRCAVPGCTKSARGRTDCCVRHGGGKRCKFESCGKSAQGSTDYCKAHGGGKRCTWGEGKCEKFARGKSGLCAAHSSMVQERETNKKGMIAPGLFYGLVSSDSTTAGSGFENSSSSSGVSVVPSCIESLENSAKRQLIPPQVLVPLSMKSFSSDTSFLSAEKTEGGTKVCGIGISSSAGSKSFDFAAPEGRVHGGGLMSLFGGNLKNAIDRI